MDNAINFQEWKKPSFLVGLLFERVKELTSFTRGVSQEEFDRLCREDLFLRKNLELEVRDVETVVKQLAQILQKI